MRSIAIAALTLALAAPFAPVAARPDWTPPLLTPKVAEALKGRTPGKALDCVPITRLGSSRIIDQSAIIYESSNRRWYVNFPDRTCPALSPGRTIITRTSMSSLCSTDIIRVVDLPSGMQYGSCGLGRFVEYSK